MLDCKNHFPISRCYGLSKAILSYYSILINPKKNKTTNKTKNKTKQRKNKNSKQTNKKIRCKQQT